MKAESKEPGVISRLLSRLKMANPFHLSSVMDLFDVGPGAAITALVAAGLIVGAAIVFFIRSAPPTEVTLTTGTEGSLFQNIALRYAKILKEKGVAVKVLTSNGSFENMERLKNPASHVDVGMVQSGVSSKVDAENLVSLGSISQIPLLVFYRGKKIEFLSELKNRKIAIGPEGSGTNLLAKAVLDLNGIKNKNGTRLMALDADKAVADLKAGRIDVAFTMSESTSLDLLISLIFEKGIQVYSFKQVEGYVRKLDYLTELVAPAGIIDFGKNIPNHDVSLIGSTIELIAVKDLHPALSDLLLEAATQVHGRPGIFQHRGEFPAAVELSIPISSDALRYYKSGKSFFYRYLPFWLASLVSRILVIFVPAFVILIPVVRTILAFFQWKVKAKIYQHYRELLTVERTAQAEHDPAKLAELRENVDRIEDLVSKMRVKGAYANQVYALRLHIDYVRRVMGKADVYNKAA
jgi:TRAP transporter TAXI family solute receptor